MDVQGKRVTVMGLGRFGGGIGVTRFLASQGADVLVTDLDPEDDLRDSIAKIQDLIDSGVVTLRLGGHNVSDFTTCDLVVANAAVPKPWENRFLRSAEAGGVPVTTEIAIMLRRVPAHARAKTAAITGSAGKSTTASMVHSALDALAREEGGRAILAGNIGGSILADAHAIDERTYLVLELSSAQLYWIQRELPEWSPHVAVVTNIAPNHIDWHVTFEHYQSSKRGLIECQRAGDICVLGEDIWSWREHTKATAVRVDRAVVRQSLKLPGEHNVVNAAAAILAVKAAMPHVSEDRVGALVADFPGLAHRLQLVIETKLGADGEPVRFYNDSKSTTPDSCLKAIEALASIPGYSKRRVHVIAGGYDKGSDLSPIAKEAKELGGLYTIGATGERIAKDAGTGAVACETLDRAVATALTRLKPGDALLLSPGCASWDQYTNFEERGDEFVSLVRKAVQK